MSDDEGSSSVIFDLGSGSIKSGMGGDDEPSSIVPSVVLGQINDHQTGGKDNFLFGYQAILNRKLLSDLNYPIQRGLISQVENLEPFLQHILENELKIPSSSLSDTPIIIGYSSKNINSAKESLAEIVLEKLNSPSVSLINRAYLSLYNSGRSSGLVLQSGEGVTHAVPICDDGGNGGGGSIDQFTQSLDFGGGDLTKFMEQLIKSAGFPIIEKQYNDQGVEHAKLAKEQICQLSMNYSHDLNNSCNLAHRHYEMEGEIISMGIEQYTCPEALFQPSLLNNFVGGDSGEEHHCSIHQLIINSLKSITEPEMRRNVQKTIVLSGGNTLFNGFSDRLQYELTQEFQKEEVEVGQFKVVAPKERAFASWIGGSILSGMEEQLDHFSVTRAEFQEIGKTIIQRKNL